MLYQLRLVGPTQANHPEGRGRAVRPTVEGILKAFEQLRNESISLVAIHVPRNRTTIRDVRHQSGPERRKSIRAELADRLQSVVGVTELVRILDDFGHRSEVLAEPDFAFNELHLGHVEQ